MLVSSEHRSSIVYMCNFYNLTQVVEHPIRDREVMGSIPGRPIPKVLKMVPVATLLGAQQYKASTGFSSPNIHRTTNIASLKNKSEKNSPIIIIVCIHRRTVWKIGSHAYFFILLRYRNNYYHNYYYCGGRLS